MRYRTAALLLAAWMGATGAATQKLGQLPFHEDDEAGARAEARRRGLPVFVEVWAPW